MKSLEKQVGGNHYKRFKIQPIEFIALNDLNFLEGNVVKYVCRHSFKDWLRDLEKAKHYIEMLIEFRDKIGEGVSPLGFNLTNKLDYLEGEIIKRIWRYNKSKNVEELEIALECIDKLIEEYKCSENS